MKVLLDTKSGTVKENDKEPILLKDGFTVSCMLQLPQKMVHTKDHEGQPVTDSTPCVVAGTQEV